MINEPETISLWEAIRQMRKLTTEGKTFSLVHATYNENTDKCDGVRSVTNCKLRPAAKGDDVKNADQKLFYVDGILNEPRTAWQILIMFFNEMKCELT